MYLSKKQKKDRRKQVKTETVWWGVEDSDYEVEEINHRKERKHVKDKLRKRRSF